MDATKSDPTSGNSPHNSPHNSPNISPAGPSDENQRPSNPGFFSPAIQTGGHNNNNRTSFQDALAELSPDEIEEVPTNTDAVRDFDLLLASLESDDEEEPSIEDRIQKVGEPRAVPSVLLETPPNRGLDDNEVLSRRKRYGWNYMKEENRSHFRTFLSFFVGPIQCVMLVSRGPDPTICQDARVQNPRAGKM